MGVNKVEYGSSTLVDLTGDTVTPEALLSGYTAHNAAGNRITGTARPGVQSFNGRSGSVLPIAGDYSANQVNYDSNKTVKQVIDALATKEASDIAGQQSLLKDTVGWTGKNLLKNTATSQTVRGVTFTVNSDGSVTANGTATGGNASISNWGITLTLPAGKYILSGCPSGGRKTYALLIQDEPYTESIFDYGDGAVIDISETKTFHPYFGYVREGVTVSNLTFYPMLRKADITDPTYEPYHESVEVMYEEEIHGVNLFDDSKIEVGKAWNGDTNANRARNIIPCEPNSEYIISMNGTNGLDSVFFSVSANIPPASQTIITSFPYTIRTGASDRYITLGFNKTNIALSDVTALKTMLRKADIEDSTYRPYNEQAIQNQLNAQGVLGAKNLLPNRISNGTYNGITFSVNADGSFSMNGTVPSSSDVSGYYICNNFKLSNGNYIFSTHETSDGRNIHYFIAKLLNGSYVSSLVEIQYNDNVPFTIKYDDTYDSIRVAVWIRRGTTINNKTAYPMIRLASDPDDTYQPYAMTNRELMEYNKGFNFLKFLFNADGNDIYSGNLNDLHAGYAYYSNAAVNIPSNYYGYCITLERPSSYNYAVQIAINATDDSVNMYVRKKASNTWGAWKTVTMS